MYLLVRAIVLVTTFWTIPAWALFESSKDLAASASVTMQEAVRTAVQALPGKAVEAQLGKEEGRVVYEVKIIDTQAKTRTVYVDALSGQAMKIEQ